VINCSETRCTLREKCQRYASDGNHKPTLPFFPGGDMPENWETYTGPLAGCPDYWPVGTGTEFFLNHEIKTPLQ